MSAKHPPALAPLERKNHRRGCVTPVTHTWQHNKTEEPLLSYPPAYAQMTLHWIHGFLGSSVPQRCTTVLHAKRVNCLLGDPHQVRYWLYYDEDLGIGTGNGISKNPWNTKHGVRKRSLQGSAHGSLLQPRPKFHGARPCTHNVAIIEGAENGWKLHNPHLLTTNGDGEAICGWVSNSKHGCKYQEIRTPSQLLSAHSSSKGSVVVGARA